ncbi:hypothetical protein [Alkalicoccus urumqiensis]|uniref:hypothetical protein n=1 Tax=Alkalicoccus urumqiensis TaxID=1548213 RepID=UPI0015E611C3|nr:hypothetical protein [Alkalicoccus urumqiensis]
MSNLIHLTDRIDVDDTRQFYLLPEKDRQRLCNWIEQYVIPCKTKTTRADSVNSYELKHLFGKNGGFYVVNGAMKGAMLEYDFDVYNEDFLNWNFNVGRKVFKVVDPEGAARDRLIARGMY